MTRELDLETRRKRLLYRSVYRGNKENDILLGQFARAHIAAFDSAELDQYEHLLDALETDLLSWMTGVADVPPDHDTAMFWARPPLWHLLQVAIPTYVAAMKVWATFTVPALSELMVACTTYWPVASGRRRVRPATCATRRSAGS